MIQGLLGVTPANLSAGSFAKWAAGSCKDQPRHFTALAGPQALVRAIVLAIHRNQLRARLSCRSDHQFPAGHQDFLIGQTDPFALQIAS